MNIQVLKDKLPDYLIRFHNVNPNKLFKCLNPEHEDRHPSMGYSSKYNVCKCFSCNERYDIFDLIKIDYGINNFSDQLKKAKEIYNIIDDNDIKYYKKDYDENICHFDFTNYYNYCFKNIFKTNYLEKRGIDKRLFLKYKIGYDENKERIIFPITKNSYFARGTKDNLKLKSRGKSYLWNEKLLKDSDTYTLIYVTESIVDALSLETINPNIMTISLNGLSNTKRLIEVLNESKFKGTLVLCFDKDYAGLTTQKELKDELSKIGISSFSVTLISNFDNDCKDLNEALLKDKDKLKKNLEYYNQTFEVLIENKNKRMEEELEL